VSTIPGDLKYTAEHEWVRIAGDIATVGITDYAQEKLGEIIYLELPPVGKAVTAMAVMATVESVKAASDIYAPVAGQIVEVNQAVAGDPSLINESPYEKAWLVKLRVSDAEQIDGLLDPQAYAEHTKE